MSQENKVRGALYEIQVRGKLDQGWECCFDGLTVTSTYSSDQQPVTTLLVPVIDQAALRGLLCKLWDFNLTLVSVRSIEGHGNTEEKNG